MFLRDFLELFFPDVERRLDFGNVEFLDKEVFTDFPEGSSRRADVVAKLATHDGKPELVLIHVEVQSGQEKEFPARMFEYYALLLGPLQNACLSRRRLPLRRSRGLDDRGIPDTSI